MDYIKLAVLTGDRYVLDQFQRLGNTYCASALEIIEDRITQKPEAAGQLLDILRSRLNDLATQIIHNGYTSKYTSINNLACQWIKTKKPPCGGWLTIIQPHTRQTKARVPWSF